MKGIGVKEMAFTGYPVGDMARSRDFYGRILGLNESWVVEDDAGVHWIEYDVAGATVGLGPASEFWKPGPDGCGMCLEVADLDAAIAALKEEGIEMGMPIGEFPACRMAVLSDPDGNGIALHQKKSNHPELLAEN